ncbi:MAG: endonuclease/exonuclease/phosphatase family protein [Pyrinomonadaceae bacterium]
MVKEVGSDVVLLCETDARWWGQVALLKKDYPNFVEKPQENGYGIALYSRLELIDPHLVSVNNYHLVFAVSASFSEAFRPRPAPMSQTFDK